MSFLALSAYILTVDNSILISVIVICVFVAIAVVSIFSKNRTFLELIGLFIISLILLFIIAVFTMNHVFAHPFLRFESVHVSPLT